jgi:hypothetical protein
LKKVVDNLIACDKLVVHMKNMILILLAACSVNAGELVDAIHMVESSGRTGTGIVGDNGKASKGMAKARR